MSSDMDVDRMIETLRKTEFLREADVRALCTRAKEIIIDESNVQRVDAPVTVRTCCLLAPLFCAVLARSPPLCMPPTMGTPGRPSTLRHNPPSPPLPP